MKNLQWSCNGFLAKRHFGKCRKIVDKRGRVRDGEAASRLIIVPFVIEKCWLQRVFQVVRGGWLLCVISISAKQKKFVGGEMKTCQ